MIALPPAKSESAEMAGTSPARKGPKLGILLGGIAKPSTRGELITVSPPGLAKQPPFPGKIGG